MGAGINPDTVMFDFYLIGYRMTMHITDNVKTFAGWNCNCGATGFATKQAFQTDKI